MKIKNQSASRHDPHVFTLQVNDIRNVPKTQSISMVGDYELKAYLDQSDGSIVATVLAKYAVNPGLICDTSTRRAAAVSQIVCMLTPYKTETVGFSLAENDQITLSNPTPVTVNSQHGVTQSVTVGYALSMSDSGSVTTSLIPSGSSGEQDSWTSEGQYVRATQQTIADWSIVEQGSPAADPAQAAWTFFQAFPFNVKTSSGSALDGVGNVLPLPSLSTDTSRSTFNGNWRFPKSIVSSLTGKKIYVQALYGVFPTFWTSGNPHAGNVAPLHNQIILEIPFDKLL